MTFVDEKKKLQESHRLEIRRIWLDKGLIALLILLAGFVTSIVLENYKSDLVKSQFLLDKRLEALKDMRISFSKLTQYAHEMIVANSPEKADAYKKSAEAYRKEFDSMIHNGNEWGFLFSENFMREVNGYLWIHEAAANGSIKLAAEYQNFLDTITGSFDTATRSALAVEVFGNPQRVQSNYFHVYNWTPKEVHEKKLKAYFLENFAKWRKENPSAPAAK
jgi:hypothetical protein